MLELLDYLKKEYKKEKALSGNGENLFIKNTRLAVDSIYIKVNNDKTIDLENIIKIIEKSDNSKNEVNEPIVNWFRARHLLSHTFDFNKSINKSPITQTFNPYCLILKNKNFPRNEKDYPSFYNKTKEYIEDLNKFTKENLSIDYLEKIFNKDVLNNINTILSKEGITKEDTKLKIFFETDICPEKDLENYKRYNQLYYNEKGFLVSLNTPIYDESKEVFEQITIRKDFRDFFEYIIDDVRIFELESTEIKTRMKEVLDKLKKLKKKKKLKESEILEIDELEKELNELTNKQNELISFIKPENLKGISPFSTTLNVKKPYLILGDRETNSPYNLSSEDISLLINFSLTYRNFYEDKTYENLKDTGIFIETEQNHYMMDITDYDIVDTYNVKKETFKEFKFLTSNNELIELSERKVSRDYLEHKINRILAMYMLKEGGFPSDFSNLNRKKIKDIVNFCKKKDYLTKYIQYYNVYKNYFVKNIEMDIYKPMKELLWNAFSYDFLNSKVIYNKSLSEKLDNIYELLNHFKKGEYFNMLLNLSELKENYKNYRNNPDLQVEIKNDAEYYFLLGQCYSYLISRRSGKKSGSLFRPILKSQNYRSMSNLLVRAYEQYCSKLSTSGVNVFNRYYQAVLLYKPTNEMDKYDAKILLSTGLIGKNIFYTKKDIEENIDEIDNDTFSLKEEN